MADEACELVVSRTFDAPRQLVWKAWTEPRHVARWWGPSGFTASVERMELRSGGAFALSLLAPDGKTYPCRGTYREVKEPERIVYSGLAEGHPCGAGIPPRATVTITFEEERGGTRVSVHTLFEAAADLTAAADAGYRQGWTDSLEILAATLDQRAT